MPELKRMLNRKAVGSGVLAVVLAAGLAGGCSKQLPQPKGRLMDYGLVQMPKAQQSLQTPQTPSGVTRVLATTPTVTTRTSRIPAKIGVAFGMAYEVSGLPVKDGEAVELVHVINYPPMKKPDGSTSTGFSYGLKARVQNGATCGLPCYSFDHNYELVPGTWMFAVKYRGKVLVQRNFEVVRE